VTDYKTILAIDTLTKDQLDIPIIDLPKYYDFFLPWAGMEKATHAAENPADVRAAEKMAKLFDEIKKDNPDSSTEFNHNLNIFFSRLLFCYFAEDTNIFEEYQFSHAIESHTNSDGSDLDTYLNRLFWVLNTPLDKRGDIPNYLSAFPYVNGGLFREEILSPKFNSKSRQLLIDSGDSNDWSAINPDIFGSMFQAVISVDQRSVLGQHYTSVPNIKKVIDPLFLNDLKEAFEEAKGNEKKLRELLNRISKIKLFDPACGSGNFLIIAYKELRRLEMQIIKELSIVKGHLGLGTLQLGNDLISSIHLNNFYGIELDDFAHEIAKLSLWLAEHQMNVEFFNEFGRTNPTLPLQEAGQIVCGNACRLDWENICPKNEGDEVYIIGNPPFKGFSQQDQQQKEDLSILFDGLKKLDYISCWFIKSSKFIKGRNCQVALVSTNSICQGEQASTLWPKVLANGVEISFAQQSFKWTNNAKNQAAVICIIVGLRNLSNQKKFIYRDNLKFQANNINSYLLDSQNINIAKRSKSLSCFPTMFLGNMPYDTGILHLSNDEFNKVQNDYPGIEKYFRKIVGSQEFINGSFRYALWIKDNELSEAIQFTFIKNMIKRNKEIRLQSKDPGVVKLASKPHQFREMREANKNTIVFPGTSSERRDYIPIGYLGKDFIVNNLAFAIFDAQPHLMSVLTSKMHMTWVRSIGGQLETRLRYSSAICYNTFPFPNISNQRQEELTQCTFRILEAREKHPEKTLAELYDPDKMPEELKEAHRLNDEAVERCYRSTPFSSDEERLEYLFKLYEKMIQEEKEKGTLFEAEKKSLKKK
jgi:type I restriction-modification system DNA methylase subunit